MHILIALEGGLRAKQSEGFDQFLRTMAQYPECVGGSRDRWQNTCSFAPKAIEHIFYEVAI